MESPNSIKITVNQTPENPNDNPDAPSGLLSANQVQNNNNTPTSSSPIHGLIGLPRKNSQNQTQNNHYISIPNPSLPTEGLLGSSPDTTVSSKNIPLKAFAEALMSPHSNSSSEGMSWPGSDTKTTTRTGSGTKPPWPGSGTKPPWPGSGTKTTTQTDKGTPRSASSHTKLTPITGGIPLADTDISYQEKRQLQAQGLGSPLRFPEETHDDLPLPKFLKIGEIEAFELRKIREFKTGGSGTVYRVYHEATAQTYALKILQNGKISGQMENEIEIFQILNQHPHKNIVRFYDAFCGHINLSGSYACCILLENCSGGSLQDYIKRRKTLGKFEMSDRDIAFTAWNVLSALRQMQTLGIVHLDVKPANILINNREEMIFKLADFGTSMVVFQEEAIEKFLKRSGTEQYKSPERVDTASYPLTKVKELFKADVWSLGITLLACYNHTINWKEKISKGENWVPLLKVGSEIRGEDIRDFLRLCLIKDPCHRPDARILLSHPFIVNPQ